MYLLLVFRRPLQWILRIATLKYTVTRWKCSEGTTVKLMSFWGYTVVCKVRRRFDGRRWRWRRRRRTLTTNERRRALKKWIAIEWHCIAFCIQAVTMPLQCNAMSLLCNDAMQCLCYAMVQCNVFAMQCNNVFAMQCNAMQCLCYAMMQCNNVICYAMQ